MRLKAEEIRLLPNESFRLLHWTNNLHDVELVTADGIRQPFTGSGHAWHYHAQTELTLVVQGSGTRFVGDSISHFKAPDLVLIGPNLPHYWHMRGHSAGYALQFDFNAEHPLGQLPEMRDLRSLLIDAQRGLRATGPVIEHIANLIGAALSCSGMGRLANFIQILDAFAKTSRKTRKHISNTTFAPTIRPTTYRSLQKAIDWVFHNFQENLSFANVLRETRLSKATFERHFKKHTGKTFTWFVAEVRLNFASRQLIETDSSVSEIALSSGYNTISHFNHQFQTLYQCSPRVFRNKMRAKASTCRFT